MSRFYFLIAAVAAISATSAWAQNAAPRQPTPSPFYGVGEIQANGRCDGISYGTGARRCNTMSGGPVGGLAGRD